MEATTGQDEMGEFSIRQFEEEGRENGVRFWYAHEFMKSLGYEAWPAFMKVVTKAMGSCATLGIDPTEAFERTVLVDEGRDFVTYKLSRFACFLVSMHGDSKKPEVAKAKASLAAIADRLIEERIRESDLGRIETREDLKSAERELSGVAKSAGLENSQQFAIFKDAGFRGMYNMSLNKLLDKKGVSPKSILYDFMGLEELAGNLFRVTQTTARVRTKGVRGLNSLSDTAQKVGKEVRKIMIENSGTAPEQLPAAENIAGVKKRLKSANRAMKKMDGLPKAQPKLLNE